MHGAAIHDSSIVHRIQKNCGFGIGHFHGHRYRSVFLFDCQINVMDRDFVLFIVLFFNDLYIIMWYILLCTEHRGVSQPFISPRDASRPTVFAVNGPFCIIVSAVDYTCTFGWRLPASR